MAIWLLRGRTVSGTRANALCARDRTAVGLVWLAALGPEGFVRVRLCGSGLLRSAQVSLLGALACCEQLRSGNEHASIRACQDLGIAAVQSQNGSNLGERMFHAISEGLLRYRKLVLVGSDCPAIDERYLADALVALDTESLVLGPANDGGYVLIGATHIEASVFQGMSWGSGTVLDETRARLVASGRSWSELNTLSDIDRPEDLPLWEAIKNRGEGAVGQA